MTDNFSLLELTVRNHPGVMSHVCGLFARRAYNMEGIICLPMADRQYSNIWLLVDERERLEQICRQLEKLHDVLGVAPRGVDSEVFARLESLFAAHGPAPEVASR